MSDGEVDAVELDERLPDLDGRGSRLAFISRRTWAFVLSVAVLVGAFVYDYAVLEVRDPIVSLNLQNPLGLLGIVAGVTPTGVLDVLAAWDVVIRWSFDMHHWLFVLSLSVFFFYVVVPLATNRAMTRRYWRRLKARPVGLVSFVVLLSVFLVALVGPAIVGVPKLGFDPPYQPPVGLSASTIDVSTCVGKVVDGACFGTMKHPLGTDGNSRDLVTVVVAGLRISLEVALISAMLLVPLATAVGTIAAEYGGWVDDLLMRYVDLQQVVPAFFVYIVVQYVFKPRLTLMLVIFGILSWGSVARMVRSEAVQKKEAEFVRAARSAGASRLWIVRKHIVPNVTNTVISAVTLQIPTLIIIEAALSYLALGDPTVNSIGYAISGGLNEVEFPRYWWVSTIPLVALLVTIVALNLFGDALRDVLDPRLER